MLKKLCRFIAREVNAGKASELLPGKMKSVKVDQDDHAVAVYNHLGSYYATGGKCSHYNAPLSWGLYNGDKVYCPYHCACFSVKTGAKITSPGLQDIPTYATKVSQSGDLIVTIPDTTTNPAGFVDHLSTRDPNDTRKFVIIGGGAAGFSCANSLRQNSYTGEITILTNESLAPYDRVLLSKVFSNDAKNFVLRSDDYYSKYGINLKTNSKVAKIDDANKSVELETGEKIKFDKLLIASGASARVPKPYQAALGLANVVTVRSAVDHDKLRLLASTSNNVIIIGGSFLGLEAANALKTTYPTKSVTVIEVDQVPLQRIMGPVIGNFLKVKFEEKGVNFILGKSADSINSSHSLATSVTIGSTDLPADLVIIATGAQINTSFVPDKFLDKDGAVKVSNLLQTDHPDIYAAGDIAKFPSVHTGAPTRIEHWSVAQDQGIYAGANMAGKPKPYDVVPFFWSNQVVNIGYIGVPGEYAFSESKDLGQKTEGYISYFFNGQKFAGVAIANWPGSNTVYSALFAKGNLPTRAEMEAGKRFAQVASEL